MLNLRMSPLLCLFTGTLTLMLLAQPVQAELEFGIPKPLTLGVINDNSGNAQGWLSPDELTLHFSSNRDTGLFAELFVSKRDTPASDWQTPTSLGSPVNAAGTFNYFPSLTADQLELYFNRANDPLGASDAELWVTQRESVEAAWSVPEKLSFTVPGDFFPWVSPDGHEIYFSSFGRDTDQTPFVGNSWKVTRESRDDPFGEPVFVQGAPGNVLSNDGLVFAQYGNNEQFEFFETLPRVGDQDVLLRTRDTTDGEFGMPVNPWAPLNSSANDYITQFSPSGKTAMMISLRPGVPPDAVFGLFGIWEAPIAEAVDVDVKPIGNEPAPINLKSKGKLPVAILSSNDFNALDIDLATLVFGDPVLIADGGNLVTPTSPLTSSYEDVNRDGLVDLTLKFGIQELIENGVLGPETTQGYVTANLYDGAVIAGRDMVAIVPATKKYVPEPGSLCLLLAGLPGWMMLRRKM